tara:strand:- start:213 stop:371 length:159 start_codon:yes stop_codon:yes gene_type:complete
VEVGAVVMVLLLFLVVLVVEVVLVLILLAEQEINLQLVQHKELMVELGTNPL